VARKPAPDSASKAKRDGARDAATKLRQMRSSFAVPVAQRKPVCACGGGCPRCQEYPVQDKLRISQPGDRYEQQADRVTKQMMRKPEPQTPQRKEPTSELSLTPFTSARSGLRSKCACGGTPGPDGECADCRRKRLQSQCGLVDRPPSPAASPIVYNVLRSTGSPLDAATRAYFEPRFGYNFSQVRIHTDASAAKSAQSVNALAYTAGRDVVLGLGRYAPNTQAGRFLLAHELAHVLQQSATMRLGSLPASLTVHDDPALEREADMLAVQTTEGTNNGVVEPHTVGIAIQRQRRQRAHGGAGRGSRSAVYFHCRTPSDHKHPPMRDWRLRQRAWARQCGRSVGRGIEDLLRGTFNINSRDAIECICGHTNPRQALEVARRGTMFPGGLASQHIDHYLTGHGADFNEDLHSMLLHEGGVRQKIATAIRHAPRGCVSIKQRDYSSHDFKYAFGAIDRMDYEVNAAAGTVHVWFRDRYEWHPEDTSRPSNCVHRAAVELKDTGAADYWMVGNSIVPLSWFTTGPSLWEQIFD
jgi:hypothetical protein